MTYPTHPSSTSPVFKRRLPNVPGTLGATWIVLLLVSVSGCLSSARSRYPDDLPAPMRSTAAMKVVNDWVDSCLVAGCGAFHPDPASAVDTVLVDTDSRLLTIRFNDAFAQIPFRDPVVRSIEQGIETRMKQSFPGWKAEAVVLDLPVSELVPNVFRSGSPDKTRMPNPPEAARPLVTESSAPWIGRSVLAGRHVAVWPSHGWYYGNGADRWEWQRPRLFRSVEDLLPMSFVAPFLAPMLEHAGADVYLPRERDFQVHEAIVDNDTDSLAQASRYLEVAPSATGWQSAGPGFALRSSYDTENPFQLGTARMTRTDTVATAEASWIPALPSGGDYAVYVSWAHQADATSDARYVVHHTGGETRFSVDQQMGAGTWVYLGTFRFEAGFHPEVGRVTLSNESDDPGKVLSADAVRFGGGMGVIRRGGETSGRPRFTEGARYYMQFAGMPDTLVYNVTEALDDYTDDYRGRAEWVNYLRGAPFGPNKDREVEGLGIPVDISFAWHTDAGITPPDSTIGTLLIYSSEGADSTRMFPNGMSRFANRDLGDLMQTTVVNDIRALYDSTWTRRSIWDRDYSEAFRPNVPGVLLELLSHQNFDDMRYALDPRFRFDVARAVYKSMVRFLAFQNGFDAVIQPLPVRHLAAQWTDGGAIRVTWQAQEDPLEPSAAPDAFVVYQRKGRGGYDNGTLVHGESFILPDPEADTVYGFRVAGVNRGGEGFPSEEVSAGRASGDEQSPVLIIAAFDRLSAPAVLDEGPIRGFAGFLDEGVPWAADPSFVGEQYAFDSETPYLSNEFPGHGASFSDHETRILTGNTFDYPGIHGAALLSAGRSFATVSDEAVVEPGFDTRPYQTMDLLLGEERLTEGPGDRADFKAVPLALQQVLRTHVDRGGNLLVSGAYVATDLAGPGVPDADREFAADILGLVWRADHASRTGEVTILEDGLIPERALIAYNTVQDSDIYAVESPDALGVASDNEVLMRYRENGFAAAVGRPGPGGVVVLGFPFETILQPEIRAALMEVILDYLNQ